MFNQGKIEIRRTDSIDSDLMQGFFKDTGVEREYLEYHISLAKLRYTAFSGDKPVGFIVAKEAKDSLVVPAVYVHPEHRRKGILTGLTAQLVRHARDADKGEISFYNTSPASQRFFQKNAKRQKLKFKVELRGRVTDGIIKVPRRKKK
jgi:ribosomal protein S18 acetylase RimI-like enzyme